MEHTPTPWIVGAQDRGLGRRSFAAITPDGVAMPCSDQATANTIVRACNSHDQLVEACKKAMTCSSSMNTAVVKLIQEALDKSKETQDG